MTEGLNIDQFNQSVSGLLRSLSEGIPDIVQVIAKDAVAEIKNRIQEKGLNAEEQDLSGYTPAYKRTKEKAGKYRGYVDLTGISKNSGDMFRKLNIVETKQEGSKYIVNVGGTDEFSQKKIDWNSEIRGDILRLSTKEEDLAQQTMDDEFQKIIDQNGFGG